MQFVNVKLMSSRYYLVPAELIQVTANTRCLIWQSNSLQPGIVSYLSARVVENSIHTARSRVQRCESAI